MIGVNITNKIAFLPTKRVLITQDDKEGMIIGTKKIGSDRFGFLVIDYFLVIVSWLLIISKRIQNEKTAPEQEAVQTSKRYLRITIRVGAARVGRRRPGRKA
jgi:hypothetical protein